MPIIVVAVTNHLLIYLIWMAATVSHMRLYILVIKIPCYIFSISSSIHIQVANYIIITLFIHSLSKTKGIVRSGRGQVGSLTTRGGGL